MIIETKDIKKFIQFILATHDSTASKFTLHFRQQFVISTEELRSTFSTWFFSPQEFLSTFFYVKLPTTRNNQFWTFWLLFSMFQHLTHLWFVVWSWNTLKIVQLKVIIMLICMLNSRLNHKPLSIHLNKWSNVLKIKALCSFSKLN